MYSFPLFIEVILYVTSLIDVLFFTISTNAVLWPSNVYYSFPLTWINSLFLASSLIALLCTRPSHYKRLSLILSLIWTTPLFLSEFPHFEFHLSLYFHYLDNLIFATPILWTCCFIMVTWNTSSMPLIDINFCFRFFDLEFLDSFSIIVYIVSDALLQLSYLYPVGICYQFLGFITSLRHKFC